MAQALRVGTNLLTGGAASITALALAVGAAAVVDGLEAVPLLQARRTHSGPGSVSPAPCALSCTLWILDSPTP
jgi:hypothetical protein